jgi:hypothetical protein
MVSPSVCLLTAVVTLHNRRTVEKIGLILANTVDGGVVVGGDMGRWHSAAAASVMRCTWMPRPSRSATRTSSSILPSTRRPVGERSPLPQSEGQWRTLSCIVLRRLRRTR